MCPLIKQKLHLLKALVCKHLNLALQAYVTYPLMKNEEREKALTIFFLCLEQSLYTKTTAVLKTEGEKKNEIKH